MRRGPSELDRPHSGIARRDEQPGPAFVELGAEVEAAHQIVYEAGGMLVASSGDCVLGVVSGTFSLAGVNAFDAELSRLVQRYGTVRFFSVVTAGKIKAQTGARVAMTNVVSKYTRQFRRAGIVVEGTGFIPTAVRSAITAIHMASSATHPLRVFSSADASCEWLEASGSAGEPKASPISASVASLRARFP